MITAVGVHKVTVTVTVSHFYSPHLNSAAQFQFLFQFLAFNSTQGARLNFNYKSIDGRVDGMAAMSMTAPQIEQTRRRVYYSTRMRHIGAWRVWSGSSRVQINDAAGRGPSTPATT